MGVAVDELLRFGTEFRGLPAFTCRRAAACVRTFLEGIGGKAKGEIATREADRSERHLGMQVYP